MRKILEIIDLIVTCTFWVFLTVWTTFFFEDVTAKIIGTVMICFLLVVSFVGRYKIMKRLE